MLFFSHNNYFAVRIEYMYIMRRLVDQTKVEKSWFRPVYRHDLIVGMIINFKRSHICPDKGKRSINQNYKKRVFGI